MRRRVDVRWRLKAENFDQLATLQRQIIDQALPCLKNNGRLVYSTCSIEPQENTQLIRQLLKDNPSLELIKEEQILPYKDQTDGAYAALIHIKHSF